MSDAEDDLEVNIAERDRLYEENAALRADRDRLAAELAATKTPTLSDAMVEAACEAHRAKQAEQNLETVLVAYPWTPEKSQQRAMDRMRAALTAAINHKDTTK
jgi:hypothetical protein